MRLEFCHGTSRNEQEARKLPGTFTGLPFSDVRGN